MPKYRVRDGQQLGHNGTTLKGGDTLEIPTHVAHEVREKVEPCDDDGNVIANEVDANLARAEDHERISILENEVQRAKDALAEAEKRLADEKTRADERAKNKPAETPAPDQPAAANQPGVRNAVDPVSTAVPVQPNQEVGTKAGKPDPISTAAPKTDKK